MERRLRTAGVAAVVVLALAGCGNVPPAHPTAPKPTATHTGGGHGSHAGPAPATTARPTPTPTARPAPAKMWVGTFRGQKVKIPYGHGAAVSFTFDDGPSPQFTPQVLRLLAQHHVPAVFCLIGTQARAYPSLPKQEVRAGHLLCDHSRDHDLNMNLKGAAYVRAEVRDGLRDVKAAAPGAPVLFYRQPGGFWSPAVVKAMNEAHLAPLRWSDDPRDWSRPGAKKIVRTVAKHLHPGVVILMHDGGGDRSQTVAALAWLLDAVLAAGWHPVLAPVVHLSNKAAAKQQ